MKEEGGEEAGGWITTDHRRIIKGFKKSHTPTSPRENIDENGKGEEEEIYEHGWKGCFLHGRKDLGDIILLEEQLGNDLFDGIGERLKEKS